MAWIELKTIFILCELNLLYSLEHFIFMNFCKVKYKYKQVSNIIVNNEVVNGRF